MRSMNKIKLKDMFYDFYKGPYTLRLISPVVPNF